MKIYFANFFPALLVIVLFTGGSVAFANEKSFIDEIKGTDTPFDNRSVKLVRPVTLETVLAKEEYQGGAFRVLARK